MVESAAYFVVAESLTNAAKYARGAAARVTLMEETGRLIVEIDDDGPGGANPQRQRPERACATASRRSMASWSSEAIAGEGTTVHAELPCE